MTAFDKAWDFLKADESYTGRPKFGGNQKQPLDMHEYPPGSGRFMSLQQMIEARNADARKNIQEHGWDYPSPNPHTEVGREIIRNYPPIPSRKQRMDRNNIMVNSETGVYDPNDPNSWHPM
jgi:hypothetical protein